MKAYPVMPTAITTPKIWLPGTRNALLEAGAAGPGRLLDEMGFEDMPTIEKG